jgi:purine-binding chemotaxis protein CheW
MAKKSSTEQVEEQTSQTEGLEQNMLEDEMDGSDETQLVSFKIEAEEYGVDIMQVQEIIRPTTITRVPRAPDFIEGVIDLRGKVLPIVDMRKRFLIEDKDRDEQTRIVVVNIDDMVVGLIVDSVSEVLRVDNNKIEPPPKIIAGIEAQFLKGVIRLDNRLIIYLDLGKILSASEIARLSHNDADSRPQQKKANSEKVEA